MSERLYGRAPERYFKGMNRRSRRFVMSDNFAQPYASVRVEQHILPFHEDGSGLYAEPSGQPYKPERCRKAKGCGDGSVASNHGRPHDDVSCYNGTHVALKKKQSHGHQQVSGLRKTCLTPARQLVRPLFSDASKSRKSPANATWTRTGSIDSQARGCIRDWDDYQP